MTQGAVGEVTDEAGQKQNSVLLTALSANGLVSDHDATRFPSFRFDLLKDDDKNNSSLSPRQQEEHHEKNQYHHYRNQLLELLWMEICRDGGISYIHLLPNYPTSRKRIQQLLKKLKQQQQQQYPCSTAATATTSKNNREKSDNCGGVTSFMERYPLLFQISDIDQCHSHPVVRIPKQYYYDYYSDDHMDKQKNDGVREKYAQALTDRVIYLLRQRSCKLKRRRLQQQQQQQQEEQQSPTIPTPAAQLTWLANKAVNELHQYVRLLGIDARPKGYAVKTKQWWKQTLPLFCAFLQNQPHHFQVIVDVDVSQSQSKGACTDVTSTLGDKRQHAAEEDDHGDDYTANVTVDLVPDVMGLHDEPSTSPLLATLKPTACTGNVENTTTTTAVSSNTLQLYKQNIVEPIATRIKEILTREYDTNNNGDHNNTLQLVGGMDVGRLLENPKLRILVGGRDLYQMIQDYPFVFEGITLEKIAIPSITDDSVHTCKDTGDSTGRRSTTNYRIHYNGSLTTKTRAGATKKQERKETKRGRLTVKDDVGLFSITASHTATAMTNCLSRALVNFVPSSSFSSSVSQVHSSGVESKTSTKRLHHSQQQHNKGTTTTSNTESILQHSICIDLTAGVGGNTVSLSRTFPNMIAIEIDSNRSQLCYQNIMDKNNGGECSFVLNHNDDTHFQYWNPSKDKQEKKNPTSDQTNIHTNTTSVQVICANVLNVLPQLGHQLRRRKGNDNNEDEEQQYRSVDSPPPVAAFLDPPWGGLDYRHPTRGTSRNEKGNNDDNDDNSPTNITTNNRETNANDEDAHDDDDKRLGLGYPLSSLTQVVMFVSYHLKPLVLGIKLPLTFNIHSWKRRLSEKKKDFTFQIVSIKKMKRQLFLVMEIQ